MTVNFIRSSEKRRIIEQLTNMYGIEELPFLLLWWGKERIRGYSGHLSKEEIMQLSQLVNIEGVGMYLLKQEDAESDFRLSFDSLHILKDQISKSIITLNKEQMEQWLRGKDIQMQHEKGAYIIRYDGMFIGTAKSNGIVLFNYVPKDRRIRRQ